jgi:dephospho-CoA kinase
MPGAGKSDLAIALRQASGAAIGHLSQVIRRALVARGQGDTPADYARMAAGLRAAEGEGVLVRHALRALSLADNTQVVVLDSLRTEAEYQEALSLSDRVLLVAVHADRERRFARMRSRSGPQLQAEADLLRQDLENLRLGVGTLMAVADLMLPNTHESWWPLDRTAPGLLDFVSSAPR